MWYALGVLIGLCLLVALIVGVVKGTTPSAPATPAPAGGGTSIPAATGTGGSSWKKKLLGLGLAVLGLVLVLWASSALWKKLTSRPSGSGTQSGVTTSTPYNVPADIAVPIICGCESNVGIAPGRQFEDDGVTPLKNRPKPGEKPSSAIGMCQILADLHEDRAKNMGYLIRTAEGNMGYAKVLYAESGTKHWEGVPGNTSKGCWGPKLAAMGTGQQVVTLLGAVDVPVDEWSKEIDTTGHRKVCWGRIDRTKGGACRVMLDKSPRMIFPIKTPTNHVGLRVLQFNCSEAGARVEVSSSN